jgi:hypothetical protein
LKRSDSMSIANTALPDDLIERILQNASANKHTLRDAVDEAILSVLHRPLTPEEQWAIIDHLDANPSFANLARALLERVNRCGEE